MKNKIIKTAAACLVSVCALSAQAESKPNLYIGAMFGSNSLDANGSLGSDTGLSLVAGLGYSKDLELRFTLNDLGEFDKGGTSYEGKMNMMDALYKWNVLDDKGQVFALAGIGAMKLDYSYPGTIWGVSYTYSDSTTGVAAQAGVGYRHHFGRLSAQAEAVHTRAFGDLSDVSINSIKLGVNLAF